MPAAERATAPVVFILLDGVGLGDADGATNPFLRAELPTFRALVGGAPVAGGGAAPGIGDGRWERRARRVAAAPARTGRATLVALDATLGVPGLPQSGTGQVALLTGENAAERFGRHFGPWTPTSLRPFLADRSLLARAMRAGLRVAFANAYPESAAARLQSGDRLPRTVPGLRAAPTLAAHAAGLLTRHAADLAAGRAVASEITNEGWRTQLGRADVPEISADRAGRNLAGIAAAHDLTFFAHYTTDHVGHRGDMAACVAALERVDAFLGGMLDALPAGARTIVAGDHGNIEDVRAEHTVNPALGLIVGPGHESAARRLRSLTDVAPMILRWSGVR